MQKCNSFRCISQLTIETADFDKSHVLSHLQMRRRNIGSKHGFGQSFNPKNPKKISELLVFCGRHGIPLQRDYADHPL